MGSRERGILCVESQAGRNSERMRELVCVRPMWGRGLRLGSLLVVERAEERLDLDLVVDWDLDLDFLG